RYSILPSITVDRIVDCMIVKGSFNTKLFKTFISSILEYMNPFPRLQSVLVMDNCLIHKLFANKENRGVRLEYLPSYLLDFNPIKQAFSLLKVQLC
ncbi:uncharacterized protein FOMMEDRAFT_85478, partial [Fomitiporia mediterranea MF3/22]|uniref:uncharacterized protein n=1 Tax=Fomitiporia mediterranea (strain MF3/22) TaxID=694068 RepID=UPI0004407F88